MGLTKSHKNDEGNGAFFISGATESCDCSAWSTDGLDGAYKYLVGGNAEEGARPLSAVSSERARDRTPMKFYLYTSKHFQTVRGIKQWGRLPKMVVESPVVETFSQTWS